MKRRTIFFWQPLLTDHAIFTFRALADCLNMDALCISDHAENTIRKDQGWNTHKDILPCEILSDLDWRSRIKGAFENDSDIHIVSSPFERSRINFALSLAKKKNARVYLTSEPYSPIATSYFAKEIGVGDKIKSAIRPALYRYYGCRFARCLKGVFAISPLAVKQYETMGVPKERIFPFGYFVPENDAPVNLCSQPRIVDDGLRIAFVGSLIARKGFATACQAIQMMKQRATLDIYGPGELSSLAPLPSNIRPMGTIPFGATQSVLANYDLLVVPSIHDGWGVVINEAIQAGVAVVASRNAGASALIDRWKCGSLFPAGNAQVLADILDRMAENADLLSEARRLTLSLKPLLQPSFAARYMAQCINATEAGTDPPTCPWY
jgi:glycosyltransferase involved in cell wall biosynthesis